MSLNRARFQGVMYAAPGEQFPDVTSISGGGGAAVATARLDIVADELVVIAPLVLLTVLLGLYPYLLIHPMTSLGIPFPVGWR